MLNAAIGIFLMTSILLVLYCLGRLLLHPIVSFFQKKSAGPPLVPSKPFAELVPINVQKQSKVLHNPQRRFPVLFSIVVFLLFCIIGYQEWQIHLLTQRIDKVESDSKYSDFQYAVDSLRSDFNYLESRLGTCESAIEDMQTQDY